MYTQCPDCHIAFRVTAKVLQQASGRVQCGGCNLAFNAVDFLSENPPVADAAIDPVDAVESSSSDLELDNNEVDTKQRFEERNTELLKALDDLAGREDIRIEDTGVEWRVLEKGEKLDPAGDIAEEADLAAAPESYLEEDEKDAQAPTDEASDTNSADDVAASIDAQTALEFKNVEAEELRYDDSTPLPDNFKGEELDRSPPPPVQPPSSAHDTEEPAEELPVLEDAQVDLAFGDPDEWLDLLDEVLEQQSDRADGTDAAADSAQRDLINDTGNAALRMEAEEELSAIHSELSASLEPYASALDGALNEDAQAPDDGEALEDESSNLDDSAVESDKTSEDGEDIADDETLTGEDGVADEEEVLENDEPLPDEEDVFADENDLAEEATALDEEADFVEDGTLDADDFRSQIALIEDSLADKAHDDEAGQQDTSADDEITEESGAVEVNELDIEKELAASSEYEPESATPDSVEQDGTINVQMHEDMRRAMEDEAFAATMTSEDGSPLIETIIMEGDFVHGSINVASDEIESKLPNDLDEPKSLIDTYVFSRSGTSDKRFLPTSGPAVIVGVIVLVLLLAGQYVHESREFLATYGMFNQTIGTVYRALGNPVTPAWDIKGWQFETTNGSTDEGEQLLTIYSSIANRSSQALPYPLVHVSLTDRWEEIVGSRVLEPNEYLAGNPDPRRPVAAGEKFTAVISIASPSEEVTGFKLNVCYRVDSGRLSCAIEDFKN